HFSGFVTWFLDHLSAKLPSAGRWSGGLGADLTLLTSKRSCVRSPIGVIARADQSGKQVVGSAERRDILACGVVISTCSPLRGRPFPSRGGVGALQAPLWPSRSIAVARKPRLKSQWWPNPAVLATKSPAGVATGNHDRSSSSLAVGDEAPVAQR